jgi:hypothetical protein
MFALKSFVQSEGRILIISSNTVSKKMSIDIYLYYYLFKSQFFF